MGLLVAMLIREKGTNILLVKEHTSVFAFEFALIIELYLYIIHHIIHHLYTYIPKYFISRIIRNQDVTMT